MSELVSAAERLRRLWVAGDHRGALKLAASWPDLGAHRDAIKKGWAAVSNPEFYRELGQDPGALYQAGLEALLARYSLKRNP